MFLFSFPYYRMTMTCPSPAFVINRQHRTGKKFTPFVGSFTFSRVNQRLDIGLTTYDHHTDRKEVFRIDDFRDVLIYFCLAFFVAVLLSIRDDLDESRKIGKHVASSSSKSSYWWGQSTRRLGRGYLDRIRTEDEDGVKNIQTYNEVMQNHFQNRIPNWRYMRTLEDKDRLEVSCDNLVKALQLVTKLKALASDYQWDVMRQLLRDPILTYKFEEACSMLQLNKGFVNEEGKIVIGFDWGSCAWRHCGAQADAQEALSELYNGLGLFEPFECLFVLDVIERSVRDIISCIPGTQLSASISSYEPYQSMSEAYYNQMKNIP